MDKITNKNIVFACGGTMGHINPALVIAKELFANNQIYFISSMKEYNNQTYTNIDYITETNYYPINGLKRKKIFQNFRIIIDNIKCLNKIKRLFKKLKIDIVISMGGGCGTICAFVARVLRIKYVIHEQNRIMGLGNRLVWRKACKVLLSYPLLNKKQCNKFLLVGNPVEALFFEKKKYLIKYEDIILIFGGSNGADKINNFFIDNKEAFNDYFIVLITGKKYYYRNEDKIRINNNSIFQIIPYTNNICDYYNRAKLVISRSGATTISEIMGLGLLSICIPSPNVVNNHQYYNALYYQKLGCLEMCEEKDMSIDVMKEKIKRLLDNKYNDIIRKNILKYRNINSDILFIDAINGVLGGKND